jgi:hypothetical protein
MVPIAYIEELSILKTWSQTEGVASRGSKTASIVDKWIERRPLRSPLEFTLALSHPGTRTALEAPTHVQRQKHGLARYTSDVHSDCGPNAILLNLVGSTEYILRKAREKLLRPTNPTS